VPAIRDGSGGIQALSRYYLTALCLAYPDRAIHVFIKNDVPEDVLPDEWRGVQFHSVAHYPECLRTLAFTILGLYHGIIDGPALVLSCHLHFLPALQVIRLFTGAFTAGILHGLETWNARGFLRLAALRHTDLVINVSKFTYDHVLHILQISPSIAVVIANTFDSNKFKIGPKPQKLLSRYGLKSDQPVLLSISRLALSERYKGHEQVLQSLAEVRKHFPTIRYLIGGTGDYATELKHLAEKWGVADLTIFAGFIPNEELCAHYQLCDLFVMPSRKEGFGIVFLEAMACGKPVIAGNKDGSVDALDSGRLGVLVDPEDHQEISKNIVDVLSKRHPNSLIFDPVRLRESVIETFGNDAFNRKVKDTLGPFLVPRNQRYRAPSLRNETSGKSSAPKLRITVLTQLTSPYQVEFLNTVAERSDCDLSVVYLTSRDHSRLWSLPDIRHRHVILSDHPEAKPTAMEWILEADVTVFNYYTHAFAIWAMYRRVATRRPWVFWGERPGALHLGFIGTLARNLLLYPLSMNRVPIWGVGQFAIQGYAEEFGSDRPFTNLPYFSDLKRFQHLDRTPESGVVRFLYCGSLSKRKGTDLLATAFLRLATEFAHIRLILVGVGPLETQLKAKLQPVSDQVEFVGFVDWDDLPKAYQLGDVFCFPSRYDGWGLALLEAMAAGLPVISTNLTGAALEYIEPGVNGWIVAAEDDEALYQAMRGALSAPIQKMGQRASQSVIAHTLENGSKLFAESSRQIANQC